PPPRSTLFPYTTLFRSVHETLTFSQSIEAPLLAVWAAFADSAQRARWSVPAGEALVYDQSNFHVGGRDQYRCGPPHALDFHGAKDRKSTRLNSSHVKIS